MLISSLGERGEGKTTFKPLHYKGTPIHRIVKGFIVQGGDFSVGKGHICDHYTLLQVPLNHLCASSPGQVMAQVESQSMVECSKVGCEPGVTVVFTTTCAE